MKAAIPLRDDLPVVGPVARWTPTWSAFFNAIARAVVWNLSLTATKTHDFGIINAHTESSTTVTVSGARAAGTPIVAVTPAANTAGIHYKGVVTADNTVTLYALNTTASSIDPDETTFRVVVLQP